MVTIAVTAEGPGETRCAISPETVKKLVGFGCTVRVQAGTGSRSRFSDETLKAQGATIVTSAAETLAGADILLICKDQGHVRESLDRMQRALTEGSITKERVAQSLKRIKKMKMKFLGRREETSLADVKEYFKRNA